MLNTPEMLICFQCFCAGYPPDGIICNHCSLWKVKAKLWWLTAGTVTSANLLAAPLLLPLHPHSSLSAAAWRPVEMRGIGCNQLNLASLLRVTLQSDNLLLAKGRAEQ